MLIINGTEWELPQINKEPEMGYADEYIEKTMISGRIRRIYRGKRFYAKFSYPFLLQEQIDQLNQLLAAQRRTGTLSVEISAPNDSYKGEAILEVNDRQKRFKFNAKTNEAVWTNWQLNIKAATYDNR